MTTRFVIALGIAASALGTAAPPELTQQDHIRINLQALIMSAIFVSLVVLTVYLLNKRAGKKRYAAHQAQLAAEGRLNRANALSEVANSSAGLKFVNDDDAAPPPTDQNIGSVFGENYQPYGKDGLDAPGS